MENPELSFSSENTLPKKFIQTDKTSETVNDSDSEGGSFTDFLTMKREVKSSCSSEEEEQEEAVQLESDTGQKKTCRAIPK